MKFGKKTMSVPVTMPTVPGKYRLTITLHDADGVVYDAATQALIPSLIVRVTGDFDGAILATPTAELVAGTDAELDVRAINLGLTGWGHDAIATASNLIGGGGAKARGADVVGRWIPLSAGAALPTDPDAQVVRTELPVGLQPGVKVDTVLDLVAPDAPGQYLRLLDIVTRSAARSRGRRRPQSDPRHGAPSRRGSWRGRRALRRPASTDRASAAERLLERVDQGRWVALFRRRASNGPNHSTRSISGKRS